MIKKYRYPWRQFNADVVKLARRLKKCRLDFIVAITRGGLPLAGMLSYHLKIKKIGVMGFSHYQADAVVKKLTLTMPLPTVIKKARVLLVDDIVDSGETMKKAKEILIKLKNKVTTAVIHYKSCQKPVIKPDYYVSDPGDQWVVYPWEIREK